MARINLSPRTGSFNRTGAELGLSQPAVSARILHLEQTVSVPLFDRTTRRVAITAAGERLRVRLDHTMTELRSVIEELRDASNLRRGRRRVAVACSDIRRGDRRPLSCSVSFG
jgi:LysR family transcriptional regulator, carnitine catabolism transcriptional activator